MTRFLTICLSLIGAFVLSGAYAGEALTSADLAKAVFEKSVPYIKGGQKLLQSSGDRLFFSMSDGSVAVTDFAGKLVQSLQAKEGGEPVLKKPEAVALGAGVIYVADSEQSQVAMFSTDGKYQGSMGAKKGGFFASGGGDSELKTPRGVAFQDGIVYVVDSGLKKIMMFGSNGVFINTLEVKPSAAPNTASSQGDEYKLRDPVDIKIDLAGRLYVLDAEDSLVKIYASDGSYLRAILWDGALLGLAVAQDGLYVAKDNEYTIQKYDFNAKLMYRFGSRGEGREQFLSLSGLAVAKERQVILADGAKGVVNFFVTEAGIPIEAVPKLTSRVFVQSTGETIPVVVNKFAWNGNDAIYAVDTDQNAIVVIRNGKLDKPIKLGEVIPIAIAIDSSGSVWILDKKKYRVIKLDISSGKIISSFGSEGSGDGQFDAPTDLQISASGKIYVADKGRDSVQIFDSEGKFINAIRKLASPISIAVDAQENLYVLESSSNTISMHSAQGALIGKVGNSKEGAPGTLLKPVALMVTPEEISVLDGSRVKVYSLKGEYLRSFGAKGGRTGELDEPVAIVQKDDMSFYIAERSNKRIQTFLTQYKPIAPQHFVAKNGLHSIELNWDPVPLPYVKQYQIYRSKDEHAGFVRVGTTSSNQFIDRGLEADGVYFYLVAAESRMGYEGATSVAVSGTSKRYTPPALAAVDVSATSWQIKMTWKPIESEFVNSYYIYQKDGNTFTKIGEAITPEFSKDTLAPNTKYFFYIAAHSTDGTEAEKFEVKTATLPFNKAPLEIEVLNLQPVFSNSYKLYEQDGVGTVRLTNNTSKEIESATLSFVMKDFMDIATETKLEKIPSEKSIEVKLKPTFNHNIFNIVEDASVQMLLEASYFENGKRESYNKNSTVQIYEKHKLTWEQPERYAFFVTPNDLPLQSFAHSVQTQYKDTKDETQLAAAVFHALGAYGITYVQATTNPNQPTPGKTNTLGAVQFPRETLERKTGSSDDLVACYVAALESLAIPTRIIEVPDHRFMMFSTGVKAEDAYTMNDRYVVYEDKLWIPVETTLVGSGFTKAWEEGAVNYYKWQGKSLTTLDLSQAGQTYKPAYFAESKWKPGELGKDSIEKKFPNESKSILDVSSATKIRPYRQRIEKDPTDAEAQLQIGIILEKAGDRKEAMKYYDKVVSLQPDNAVAHNNRGNLLMRENKFADAQQAFQKAVKANPEDQSVWLNLANAYKAGKKTKEANEALAKAKSLESISKK
jgi:tetratricopeptide (TPR) repeat protein/DNA-binding beta-propeller fold protein YncE